MPVCNCTGTPRDYPRMNMQQVHQQPRNNDNNNNNNHNNDNNHNNHNDDANDQEPPVMTGMVGVNEDITEPEHLFPPPLFIRTHMDCEMLHYIDAAAYDHLLTLHLTLQQLDDYHARLAFIESTIHEAYGFWPNALQPHTLRHICIREMATDEVTRMVYESLRNCTPNAPANTLFIQVFLLPLEHYRIWLKLLEEERTRFTEEHLCDVARTYLRNNARYGFTPKTRGDLTQLVQSMSTSSPAVLKPPDYDFVLAYKARLGL